MHYFLKKTTLLFCLSFIFCSPLLLKAQEAAPFGLSWGQSLQELKALGLSLEPVEAAKPGSEIDIYQSKNLPRNEDWAKNYALLVDKKAGLVKIVAYGGDILNDLPGQMGRRIYYKLKAELENKSVLLSSSENDVGNKEQNLPAGMSFYACLENGPCGAWRSLYTSGDVNIELSLEGLSVDAGYVSVIYENSKLTQALSKNTHQKAKNKKPKNKNKKPKS